MNERSMLKSTQIMDKILMDIPLIVLRLDNTQAQELMRVEYEKA